MTAAPSQKKHTKKIDPSKYVVLLGTEPGVRPTLDDEPDDWRVVSYSRFMRGGRPDTAVIRKNLAKNDERIVDRHIQESDILVEIRRLDDDDEPTILVATGKAVRERASIDDTQETLSMEVVMADELFGDKLTDYPIWDPIEADFILVQRQVIFNPEVDDTIRPNRSDRPQIVAGSKGFVFVDSESTRSATAQSLQNQNESLWDLPSGVEFLCLHLNEDETFVTNPTKDELTAAFVSAPAGVVNNQKIDFGVSLPEALDQFLTPHNYSWYLVHEIDETDPDDSLAKTMLRFFKRGEGQEVELLMQRPETTENNIDSSKTNTVNYTQEYSIIDELSNRVEAYTALKLREGTFELEKAWPQTDDGLFDVDLEKTQDLFEQKRNVGRKWILDVAGDYKGSRPEITAHFSLTALFAEATSIRRRRFRPCISLNDDSEPNGVNGYDVQWWNPDAEGGAAWETVPWSFSILEKECGVYFDGPTPPDRLMALLNDDPSTAKVRITASIEGDSRTKGTATRRDSSPNASDVLLPLELSNRFYDRKVHSTSVYFGTNADEADDAAAIKSFAEKVRDSEDSATISVGTRVPGANHDEYEIGCLVRSLKGRDLHLDANNRNSGSPRYPQVVGINIDLEDNQNSELLLDTFEEEVTT